MMLVTSAPLLLGIGTKEHSQLLLYLACGKIEYG